MAYIEQSFPIECQGRNEKGEKVLQIPEKINVIVYSLGTDGNNTIQVKANCKFNTGSHGQRCKASHPEKDKVGNGVICPYSLDIPYVLDKKN